MPLKKLNSLHARLFAIVLLVMLPMLLMALFMARDRYQEARSTAVQNSRHLAKAYAADGKALFDRARLLMVEIAALNAVRSLDSAACAEILATLGREHPEYGAISLSRPDGRLIARSQNRPEQPSPSGAGWFNDLLRKQAFVVGSYQGGSGGEPARLPLAQPVLAQQDGSLLAVLSMSLDLKALADVLDDMPLPEGAAVSILDRSGIMLARFPVEPQAVGRPAPEADSFLPKLLAGGQDTWEARGVDGVERLYFLAPLLDEKEQGIFLRIGMPSAVAFAAAQHGLVRNLSFVAAMSVLALFSTWLFSNVFVLRQVKTLWLATKKMSAGDFSHRIGETGSGELADLIMAFDGMAQELESRTSLLIAAEHKYRKLFEDSVNGIFQTTPEGRILEANPALARILGFGSPQELINGVGDIASQLYAEPELRQEVHTRLKRDGVLSGFEFRARRVDGEQIWLSIDARAVLGQDGTIAYYEGSASDITYRKMIEQELRNKQEKFQALLDNSPALISIKDAEGRYVLVNRRHQELHGLDQGVIGKSVDDFFLPEEVRLIRDEDRQVLAGGKPLTFRHSLSIQGVRHHFMAVKFPLYDNSGRPDRVCGISYDITDYEKVREALRQSEEKYRTMIQTSPDLIWMLDPRGIVVEANNASNDLLGYDPKALRGMHFHQIFHPEDVLEHDREQILSQHVGLRKKSKASPKLINERRQLPRSTKSLNVRLIPKASEGQAPDPRHFELSSCGLWQNMVFQGTMMVIRDITERRRAELALRESQDLLAYTQGIGKIGGWSINLDTRERKWTLELDRLLGLKGAPLPDIDEAAGFVAPEDHAQYAEAMHRAEELGEPIDVELRLAQQGTSHHWVRLMGKRVDSGGVRVLSGSVQDITDKKNLEKLRDDIDNIIRHDLKTPLNGIINLPQLMMGDPNLTPDQVEYLRYIEEGGKKMLRQVEMSLDIMKIERGQFQYKPYPFDLLGIVRSIEAEMQEVAERKKLSVEIFLHGELATDSSSFVVRAEERLCYPMLSNLMANAIEASPAGERVTLALSEDTEQLVSIRNIGAVPLEIRERFFEKFVTSGKFKGTGLGTYSASLFARAQGGSVELDASEEGATTVLVRLPKNSAPGIV